MGCEPRVSPIPKWHPEHLPVGTNAGLELALLGSLCSVDNATHTHLDGEMHLNGANTSQSISSLP